MGKLAKMLRDHEVRQVKASTQSPSTGRPKPMTAVERELAEIAYLDLRFEELEGEMIFEARDNEPKSIHSPTQPARVRFSPPIPKGTGPQKRFSVNGW